MQREHAVLAGIRRAMAEKMSRELGYSNEAIAKLLGVRNRTVSCYLHKTRGKFLDRDSFNLINGLVDEELVGFLEEVDEDKRVAMIYLMAARIVTGKAIRELMARLMKKKHRAKRRSKANKAGDE